MFSFLLAIRNFRQSVKAAQAVREVFAEIGEEVLRNGMAYAFEVGTGQPLAEEVILHPMNPFSDPNWRNGIMPIGEPSI